MRKNEEKTKRRTDDNVYRVKRVSVGRLHERCERRYVGRLNTGNRGWVTLAGWSSQLADKAVPSVEQRFQQETRPFHSAKGLSREKRYNVTSPSPSSPPRVQRFRRAACFSREKLSLRGCRERLPSPLPFHRVRFDHPSLRLLCLRRRGRGGEKRPKRENSLSSELASQLFSTRIQEFKTSPVDRCEPFYLLEITQ